MELKLDSAVLELKAGEVVTLDDAIGASVQARLGSVWITEEGDVRDIVLGPGENRVIKRAGRTLIQAMQTSWISIRTPQLAMA
jgi:hypothetical protein